LFLLVLLKFCFVKDWGDTPLPGEEAETLAKLTAVNLSNKEVARLDGDLHPADAGSTLQLVKVSAKLVQHQEEEEKKIVL
jgi:hypothetical protein